MAPGVRYAIQTPESSAGFSTGGVVFRTGDRELHLNFRGANAQTAISGRDELTGRANFLLGNDEKDWKKDVPLYSRIQYANLYPGITAAYAIDRHRIKSEYSVDPGADPHQIILNYADAESIVISKDGALEIVVPRA